jgi:hypothetical protein
LLAGQRALLQALAQALLEKETLDSQEIDNLLAAFRKPDEEPETQDAAAKLSLSLQQA